MFNKRDLATLIPLFSEVTLNTTMKDSISEQFQLHDHMF